MKPVYKKDQKYTTIAVLFLLMFILGGVYILTNNSSSAVQEEKAIKKASTSSVTKENTSSVASNKEASKESFLKYTDKIAGAFAVEYPKDWELQHNKGGQEHLKASPKNDIFNYMRVTSTPLDNPKLATTNYRDKEQLKKMSSAAAQLLKNQKPGLVVLKDDNITMGEYKGRELSVEYFDIMIGKKMVLKQIIFPSQKNLEFFEIKFEKDKKKEFEPIFDYMLSTYKSLK